MRVKGGGKVGLQALVGVHGVVKGLSAIRASVRSL
jgi:hypothetical protein